MLLVMESQRHQCRNVPVPKNYNLILPGQWAPLAWTMFEWIFQSHIHDRLRFQMPSRTCTFLPIFCDSRCLRPLDSQSCYHNLQKYPLECIVEVPWHTFLSWTLLDNVKRPKKRVQFFLTYSPKLLDQIKASQQNARLQSRGRNGICFKMRRKLVPKRSKASIKIFDESVSPWSPNVTIWPNRQGPVEDISKCMQDQFLFAESTSMNIFDTLIEILC